MLLMNHKIPDRKLCKILDTLSVIILFLLSLLLFLTKNIRLCHHCKFDQWIFKAFFRMTINHHDLTRQNLPVIILPVKSSQSFFLEILRQSFSSGTGTGEQCDLVSLFLILVKILYQKFKATVIRTD